MLMLSGCFGPYIKTNDSISDESQNKNVNTSIDTANNVDSSEPVIPRFYPNTLTGGDGTSSDIGQDVIVQTPSDFDFVVTQELEVRLYLVDRYNQGVCYGKPVVVSQSMIDGVINNNSGLSSFVRGKYGFTSDLEVYNKIKQINGINLNEKKGGSYIYSFTDGQCCVQKSYQGEINIIGKTISDEILKTEIHQNPC